jgi:hypothetical protein
MALAGQDSGVSHRPPPTLLMNSYGERLLNILELPLPLAAGKRK